MFSSLVTEFIALVEVVLPYLIGGGANTQAINTVLNGFVQIMPQLEQLGAAEITSIQNIIAALKSSGNLTATQMDQLDTFDQQTEAAFEAAAAAAGVDPAA